MTMVVDIRALEDCFEGGLTYEIELDEPMDQELMVYLGRGGKLEFHPEFPRPYFRITQPRAWIAQGVLGNRSFRLTGTPSCVGDPALNLKRRIEEGERKWEQSSNSILRS